MLVQLNPPLSLKTPKGDGLAHFVIDHGPGADLLWVVFMDADGACWTVPNPEVRLATNWPVGRRPAKPKDEGMVAPPRFRPTLAAVTEA